MPSLNPIDLYTAIGQSPIISSSANFSQLISLYLENHIINNQELLLEIQRLFDSQNKERLDTHYQALVKSLLQNEKIISQNQQLFEQNIEILQNQKLILTILQEKGGI